MEEVLRHTEVEEFARSTQEASNVVTIKRGGNRANRFLKVAVQGEGGRRGFIMLPKGREGWGWGRFSVKLSKVLDFLEVMKGRPFSNPGPRVELSSEPPAKKTPSHNPFQQLGVDDGEQDDHAEAIPSTVEEGGRVVQSKKKALLSPLWAWKGKFKVLGEMNRTMASFLGWPRKVWVALRVASRAQAHYHPQALPNYFQTDL
jgi:hypothetical protein